MRKLFQNKGVQSVIRGFSDIAKRTFFRADSLTIVSAADQSHERSLFNFIESALAQEPDATLIAYDLGMSKEGAENIRHAFPKCELRAFNFSKYPPHLDMSKSPAGDYAWKAPIVAEVAEEFGGLVCWMDAGNIIRYPLVRFRSLAQTYGYYAQMSDGPISKWTHPGMLSFFGLPPDWNADKQNLNTAGVIFNTESDSGRKMIKSWAAYSMHKECIAPTGSSKANHRQDQALFTVLAYYIGGQGRIASYRHPEFVSHRDIDHT